ncbi:MAG: hypothetical protein FJ279_13890, partial [Planctomycetes bacterium]|nr:hypothetical protein [Planctomycetota bacterium]
MSWQRLVASSLALLWCASVAHGACSVTEEEGRITLENDHLRVALVPAQGGKCASVFFKDRQTELTSWPNYGCLEDRRWGPQGYERLRNYPYQARIIQRGPQEVSVALSSRCNDPGFTQMTVEKTLILRDGETGVEVRYRWENASKVTLPLGWWFFQDLAIQGKKNAFYASTPFGVEKTVHVPGDGQTSELLGRTPDRFLYDVPRGWSAVIGETGVGAAATFDVKHTTFIYNFANPHETTLEWAFNQIDLEAGKSFETAFRLFPIADLPTVDGVGEGLAGSLTTPGREGAWRKPAEFTAGEVVPIRAVVVGCRAEAAQA